jgi:hypothetical protein
MILVMIDWTLMTSGRRVFPLDLQTLSEIIIPGTKSMLQILTMEILKNTLHKLMVLVDRSPTEELPFVHQPRHSAASLVEATWQHLETRTPLHSLASLVDFWRIFQDKAHVPLPHDREVSRGVEMSLGPFRVCSGIRVGLQRTSRRRGWEVGSRIHQRLPYHQEMQIRLNHISNPSIAYQGEHWCPICAEIF